MHSGSSSCFRSSCSSSRSSSSPQSRSSSTGLLAPLPLQRQAGRPLRRHTCSAADSQVQRFRHQFNPGSSGQPPDTLLGWPLQQDPSNSSRIGLVGEETRVLPEQLWASDGPAGSVQLGSRHAQHLRVTPVPVPAAAPGSQFWQIEVLGNPTRAWPSLSWADGRLQFKPGFLAAVDDPKVVPFFFYRGLEQLRYSWGERAFQVAFAAAYAGVHLAIFSWFWASSPALAAAVGFNWCLGTLSLGKWVVLLWLASQERLWLYGCFLVAQAIDKVLARHLPPVRQFCWAMFSIWALYVVVSPSYYYPLPFAPFVPGSLGAQEAFGG